MHSAEEVDKCHCGITGRLTLCLHEDTCGDGNDGEDQPHQTHTPKHERTSAYSCREESKCERARETEHCRCGSDQSRLDLFGYASVLEHCPKIVRDKAVATPLYRDIRYEHSAITFASKLTCLQIPHHIKMRHRHRLPRVRTSVSHDVLLAATSSSIVSWISRNSYSTTLSCGSPLP